jgi:CheY-like chemotaxis protein
MGLAMVYGIVKNHGGAVSVQSEVGKGTTFELFLPADEGVAAVDGSEPERQSIYGRGLVLVVDDEEPVRQVVSSMLTELGYSVVTAGNGQEGIEIFRKRRSEIDLVILDVTMPVLDGVACFGELRQIDPEVRVVVSTGHAVDRAAQLLLDRGARGFVQKPFVKSDLSQALAKALSDAAQPQR